MGLYCVVWRTVSSCPAPIHPTNSAEFVEFDAYSLRLILVAPQLSATIQQASLDRSTSTTVFAMMTVSSQNDHWRMYSRSY